MIEKEKILEKKDLKENKKIISRREFFAKILIMLIEVNNLV